MDQDDKRPAGTESSSGNRERVRQALERLRVQVGAPRQRERVRFGGTLPRRKGGCVR